MADHAFRTPDASEPWLRVMMRTLTRSDMAEIAIYVLLSLGAALAGGLAAVSLVPLIQPGLPPPLVGGLLDLRGGWVARALLFAGVTAVFTLLRWQTARLGARLVSRYGVRLRRQVHARLIGASLRALADSTSAEIANALTHNVEIAVQGFAAMLQLLVAGLTCMVSLGLALWVSPPLVLAAPVLAAIGLLASRMFGREQAQVSRRYVADMTSLFWHSEDFPRRLRHVRSFGREEAEKASYGETSARLGDGYRRQLELVASGRLVVEVLAACGIVLIFVVAQRWGGVEQASLIAVCLLLGRLLPYLAATRQSFQQLRTAGSALELWQRYMDVEPSGASAAIRRPVSRDTLHIDSLRVIPPSSGVVVNGLMLKPGELTLVYGDSGIGKSSLTDVLAGMMAPQSFSARIAGRAISFDEYCELVRDGAYVSQSVRPWQRTVRECLLWAEPDATEDTLRSVLTDVGLDERLARSPDGLDTALHDATSRMSGGELQRLLLAQVLLRQPYLALLDEATSALDAAAELSVLSVLKRRLPHTIMVVISHRHGVMAVADQQLMLDGGVVASICRDSLRAVASRP
ncbi:ATP-binding cassette domain-containing protein [Dyella koreensis]|uniref:ABC transporter ATP-binding protein n=1 Tax=Dyella koreensis TaxID=311235 RepID=A0ABW8K4V1_9GAMM